MRGTILVVDDQRGVRLALASELEEAGYDVVEAADGKEAWNLFCEASPELVITDMVMPRSDGMDLLGRIRSCSDVPVIMFTAHGSIESAVSAVKEGANEFISSDRMDIAEFVGLVDRLIRSEAPSYDPPTLLGALSGASRAMIRVRERLAALAPLHTPVLLVGEQGSGRATAAQALHELANETILRSFDSNRFRPDDILPATSTIYLRNIERLPLPAQRFWADRLTSPSAPVKPRLIAATSVLMDQQAGFHLPLARELLRFDVHLPPLRERPEDIRAIADSMISRIGRELGRPRLELSRASSRLLSSHPWPGNLTELNRLLEKAVAFSTRTPIRSDLVSELLFESQETIEQIRRAHLSQERESLLLAIRSTGGNISRTAEIMGRSRSAVYRLVAKHRITLPRVRNIDS
jgi:DNA-binding NtrC family response regulator